MSDITSICNRALAEIGTRSTITSLNEPSTEAVNCSLVYDPMRKRLLRAAHWGFARTQLMLAQLGTALDGKAPFPFLYSYAYPSDCLAMRYCTAVPPGWPFQTPGTEVLLPVMPSRNFRFMVTNTAQGKAVISNVFQAIGVYTKDVTDTSQFDPMFEEALVAIIAAKVVIPLTGNVQMKTSFMQQAQLVIDQARCADGNEAVPTTDHTPDWIRARGLQSDWYYSGVPMWGTWFNTYDSMSWAD